MVLLASLAAAKLVGVPPAEDGDYEYDSDDDEELDVSARGRFRTIELEVQEETRELSDEDEPVIVAPEAAQ